jgi:predicted metal-dependent hydrolase
MERSTVRLLMESLNRDAERIARHFGLRYKSIDAERANVKSRYGVCYSDGAIRIRLRHATTGRPLKYSSLVNTLCHELAHLRHFNHGLRFRAFYQQLLEYARAEGIYRPGRLARAAEPRGPRGAGVPTARRRAEPAKPTGPVQLPLL